jgi:hypothetical protein
MNRYLDVDAELENTFQNILANDFPNLAGITFKLLFDTKKRVTKGNIVISSVELTNEKVRFLTADALSPEGYDCLLILDNLAWQYTPELDKKRILSHELNHVMLDEKGKLKIVGHDVEDFASEIAKNADDPNWSVKLAQITRAIYDQQEDQQQEEVM